MTKTKLMLKIEKQINEDFWIFINREYSVNKRKLVDISNELNISRSSLANFMRFLNIPIRKPSETKYGKRVFPSKEKLALDYLDERMPVKEIEKKYKLSRSTIWILMKKYDLPLLTKRERYKIKNRVRWLTEDEEQIILGSILGDANINLTINSAFFEEAHCLKQENYLLWKRDYAFSRFNVKVDYRNNNVVRLWTEISPLFKDLREKFYPGGKKIITKEILNKLKPLGLAVWFMDDGSLNLRGGGDISTDCFTKKENELIRDYFNKKGFYCKVFKRKSGTYKIIFNVEGFKNFIEVIKNYIHPSMSYKIDLNRVKEYRKINLYPKH